MVRWIKLALAIALMAWMLQQCRKPTGPIGRLYLWIMNRTHAHLTNWALQYVPVRVSDTVLDVGCGGGRTVQKLAAMASEGTVHGVDYSAASVAASRRQNAEAIRVGHVRIELASVAGLPFPDETFDVVTAFETHYYWPDLPANLREILRVLKPGGRLALVAEAYRTGRFDLHYRVIMPLLRARYLSATEHHELLDEAGFTEVSTVQEPRRTWICAMGRRPSTQAGH